MPVDWEDALRRLIADPDATVRRTAVEEACNLGLDLGDTEALLDDADPAVRLRVIAYVDREKVTHLAHALLPRLTDDDGRVRTWAAGALWRLGGKGHCDAIWPLLQDEDAAVRHAAFMTLLGRRSEKDTSTPPLAADEVPTERLNALLAHREPTIRRATIEVIGRRRGQRPPESLLPFLEDPAPEVRAATLAALRDLDFDRLPEVARPFLADADPRVRESALDGTADAEAVAPMIVDPDSRVRRKAAYRLSQLASKERALEAVVPLFDDEDPEKRGDALLFLRDHFLDREACRAAALLTDPDANVRALACTALGTVGNLEHTDAITALMADSDLTVRREAVDALRCLGEGTPVEPVLPLLCCDDDILAYEAEQFVIDRVAVEDLTRIVTGLDVAPPVARAATLTAVAIVARRERAVMDGSSDPFDLPFESECCAVAPDEGAGAETERRMAALEAMAAPLASFLSAPEPSVRAAAARAVGWTGLKTSLPDLEHLLSDGDVAVRREAILAFGRLGGRLDGGLLARSLRDPGMADAALFALEGADAADREAAVQSLLADDDPAIRTMGARAAAFLVRACRE